MNTLLVFLLPLIIGVLTYFFELKNDKEQNKYKRLTFPGWIVIVLSTAYLIFGVFDMISKNNKDDRNETKINSLTSSMDSLIYDSRYIKGQNESYYVLLTALGYKMDTTQKGSKRSIDSLLKIINKPKTSSNSDFANLDICVSTDNLNIRHGVPLDSFNVDICNGLLPVYEIKLKWDLVGVINGIYKLAKYKSSDNNPYLFNIDNGLPSNGILRSNAPLYREYVPTDSVFLYIHGTYKDAKGKIYKLNRYFFTNNGKVFYYINESYLTQLKEYLHKEGIL